MNTNQPIKTCSPAFGAKCAALLLANSEVLSEMLQTLPQARLDALDVLLAGGGRIGIECVVDRSGTNHISLVGIEAEGAHLTLATVAQPQVHGSH